MELSNKNMDYVEERQCKNCKTIVKYLHNDQKEIDIYDEEHGEGVLFFVTCPVCGEKVYTRLYWTNVLEDLYY